MSRLPDPATLAPHVDKAWADDFIIRLRMRDVPGDRIGDALAEVDAHCADSGEGAPDAFGDAEDYADSLDLPELPDESGVRSTLLGSGLQLVGIVLAPQAFGAIAAGEHLVISAGGLATLAVTVAILAAFARWHDQVLGGLIARPWPWSAAFGLLATASFLPLLLWKHPVADVAPWAGVLVSVALLAAGVIVQAKALGPADPVVLPGVEAPQRARKADPVVWMMPVAAVVLSIFAWLVAR